MTGTGTLIVFIRAPVPGRVKTRLAPALANDQIVSLYRAFVQDVLETAGRVCQPVTVAYTPPETEIEVRRWLGAAYRYRPQSGNDLGRRMADAFRGAFAAGFHWALVLGSDLPDLPASHLRTAVRAVARTGAVLGPSIDGGYYLIGFRADRFTPAVFEGIAWGSRGVRRQTIAAAQTGAVPVHQLPAWPDVDTPEDLEALCRRLPAQPDRAPRTRAWLQAAGRL